MVAQPTSSLVSFGSSTDWTSEFGADCFDHESDLIQALRDNRYLVFFIERKPSGLEELLEMVKAAIQSAPHVQIVLAKSALEPGHLYEVLKIHQPFFIFSQIDHQERRRILISALSAARESQSRDEFRILLQSQERILFETTKELEARVADRQSQLDGIRVKLEKTRLRFEVLQEAIFVLHKSTNIVEMEDQLTEILGRTFHLAAVKILFDGQDQLKDRFKKRFPQYYSVPLRQGEVFYFSKEASFDRTEKEFLKKLTDAVALSAERLIRLEELENIGKQWEMTFNSILSPITLIGGNYDLIQVNSSLLKLVGLAKVDVVGRKCYKVLFQRDSPCENCTLGKVFELPLVEAGSGAGQFAEYKVLSFAVKLPAREQAYFQMYQDQKDSKIAERRVIQNSKLVELGTIGSSIAHELNNPIGGIINYLQLILMDLAPAENNDLYEDIKAMEEGALRCKEIVENLLSFTRKPNLSDKEWLDLGEVLLQACKITELQTRVYGIELVWNLPQQSILFFGVRSYLSQAFRNILQNAAEAIEQVKGESDRSKLITVSLERLRNEILILIEDTGIGMSEPDLRRALDPLFTRKNPNLHTGLGLTLSYQIISEHSGDLTLLNKRSGKGVIAKISFPLAVPPT